MPEPSPDARGPDVVAYIPDLMDRSKVRGARFVSRPADLVDAAEPLVVVDLSRAGVLDVLPLLAGRRVVGFGSHVARDVLDAARAVGCEALPRSAFFSRWPDV